MVRISRSALLAPFEYTCVRACSGSQSCPTLCHPMDPARFLCPGNFPGKDAGVGCISHSIQTHSTVLLAAVTMLSITFSSSVLLASCMAFCSVKLFPFLSNTYRIPSLSTSPDFYEKQIWSRSGSQYLNYQVFYFIVRQTRGVIL